MESAIPIWISATWLVTANGIQIYAISNGICDSIEIWPENRTSTVIHSGTEQGCRCAIDSQAYHFVTDLRECHCETGICHCRPMPANGNGTFRTAATRLDFWIPSATGPNRNGTVGTWPAIVSEKRNEISPNAGIPNGTDWIRLASWSDCDSVAFRNGNDLPAVSWIWNRAGPWNDPV